MSHPPLHGDQELVLQVMRALLQLSQGGPDWAIFIYKHFTNILHLDKMLLQVKTREDVKSV